MTDVPDWAIDKALYLMGEGGLSARDMVGAYASTTLKTRAYAFARYIAEHEEEPVDPLLAEAREIASHFNQLCRPAILVGHFDDNDYVKLALAALRRGLELARTKSEAGE